MDILNATLDAEAKRERLIAAAPDLLAALTRALPHLEENFRWHRDMQSHARRVVSAHDALEAAKAAIAKAEAVSP